MTEFLEKNFRVEQNISCWVPLLDLCLRSVINPRAFEKLNCSSLLLSVHSPSPKEKWWWASLLQRCLVFSQADHADSQ